MRKLSITVAGLAVLVGLALPAAAHATDPVFQSGGNFGAGQLDPDKECSVVTREWFCRPAAAAGKNGAIEVVNAISNYLVLIFGPVLILICLWYIIKIIASAGSADQISQAKSHLAQAAVSLGLLVAAYAIIQLIGLNFPS